jgi:hypothetical protein
MRVEECTNFEAWHRFVSPAFRESPGAFIILVNKVTWELATSTTGELATSTLRFKPDEWSGGQTVFGVPVHVCEHSVPHELILERQIDHQCDPNSSVITTAGFGYLAYAAYRNNVWVATKTWEDLERSEREGWVAVAMAVIEAWRSSSNGGR